MINFNDAARLCLILICAVIGLPGFASAEVLTKNTIWQGEVKVSEDLLVPEGITLTIRPGTVIKVVAAESTKTDPEYLSPLTEITIRGILQVEGTEAYPVLFSGEEKKPGSWAGIIVDQGRADMQAVRITDAEAAVTLLDGTLQMKGAFLRDNRYGLVLQGGKADAVLEGSTVSANDYGVSIFQGARLTTTTTSIEKNYKKDRYTASTKAFDPGVRPDSPQAGVVSRRYLDGVAMGETVWQGRIEVAGLVRVPEGSRLIILPGTLIEFVRRDTNGDGIGENGLLIQGRLIAKGTKEQPITFRSAEKNRKMGDWDSINIMNSAGSQNLVEHCRIEDAYRGIHFHFSHVTLRNSVLSNNYRGVQFQESLVDMKGNQLIGNKSGVQGRDSDISFTDNILYNNYVGANFFRTTLYASGNRFMGNWKEGWRIREGVSTLRENLIDGNRQGLMLADMFYGSYNRNSFTNNLETGLSLKNAINVEINGNVLAHNGITGLSVQETQALIKGNQITDNAERGIGVLSFDGVITENNLAANGRYAIDMDGTADVAAPSNWWGGDEPAQVVLDKRIDPARGNVLTENASKHPFPFAWPLAAISTDTTWRGKIGVTKDVSLLVGAELKIMPGTTVEFSSGTGMLVKGRMIASGRPAEKIRFTSLDKKGAGDWNEIQLEYATGSTVSHCIFEYSTWGLHSHFTNLVVTDSLFANNTGGMRFRSGPVQIQKSTFENNIIGIRAYRGNAVIRENNICRNETGIFVREKGGGLSITQNNLFNNSNYNVRVGDFNNEDVPAPDNWWGDGDPLETIFDGRNEPGIGNVLIEPQLTKPVVTGAEVKP